LPTAQLPEQGKLMSALLDDVVFEFIKLVAPYLKVRKVELVSRSKQSERGIKLATNELREEALEMFKSAEKVEDPPDGAIYNQGVVLEALGRLEEAEKAYKRAMAIDPDNELYMKALRRVRQVMEEQKE
jgi:tetratricopeptide (TPR) repeat protein